MARRCRWCNKIITEERRIISQSTMDFIKEEYGVTDPEETSALPMCIDCLEKMSKGESVGD